MSTLKIRQPPKLTAIPIPIHTNQKQRRYNQLKTVKPKVNWSRYSFLPAIVTTELGEFIKNENDLYEKGPTKYDDISDSEFLYDQMTAESDEIIKREAAIKIVREKAFLQFLELKSDYMDWVIKMAHKNEWVSMENHRIHEKVSIPQPPMTDNPGKHVSSSPTNLKDNALDRDNPDLMVPKRSSPDRDQSASSLSTDISVHKPPAYPKHQPRSSASPKKCVPKPPAYPKDLSATILRNKNVIPKSAANRKDLPATSLGNDSTEPEPPALINYLPANIPGNENSMTLQNDQSRSTSRLSGQYIVPKLPTYSKGPSSSRSSPLKLVLESPAYPVKLPKIRGSPDSHMLLPSPPAYPRASQPRKVRRADIVTELGRTSSSQTPELSSPRIVLALI